MAHDVNQGETDVAAQVRSSLLTRIEADRLDLWMPATTTWEVSGNSLRLGFVSPLTCEFAESKFKQALLESLREVLEQNGTTTEAVATCQVSFAVVEAQATDTTPAESQCAPSSLRAASTASSSTTVSASYSVEGAAAIAPLTNQPTLTMMGQQSELWTQFVRGESNQFAVAAANLVLTNPGDASPVFIHGPNGVGKSMLVTALSEQLRIAKRLPRVTQMTSEQFLNEFTEGLRGSGLPMFRRKYRELEALIIEDIQFFLGKKSSMQELKNTLDNLLRLKKQVIFTADRSLNDLMGLGTELVGRIRGGLNVPIFPLDFDTRCQVLEAEAGRQHLDIPQTVITELASRLTGDGRVLSGVLKRLKATTTFQSFQNCKLDWETCWSSVGDLVQATQPVVRIRDIERVVCDVFGLEPGSLKSTSKMRRVSQPRMLAMFLARKYTPSAYKEIGTYFGKRRHSTVISAEKTVEGWLDANADMDLGRGISVRQALQHVESQLQVG